MGWRGRNFSCLESVSLKYFSLERKGVWGSARGACVPCIIPPTWGRRLSHRRKQMPGSFDALGMPHFLLLLLELQTKGISNQMKSTNINSVVPGRPAPPSHACKRFPKIVGFSKLSHLSRSGSRPSSAGKPCMKILAKWGFLLFSCSSPLFCHDKLLFLSFDSERLFGFASPTRAWEAEKVPR